MNIFFAQASCWEAVCQMARSLTKPAIPSWAPFQNHLLYVATHEADRGSRGGKVTGGEPKHKIKDRCNFGCCVGFGQWEGHSQGVQQVRWACASGARIAVYLNDDLQSYAVLFLGAESYHESPYLFDFYRAVSPDTIRVEELSPPKLKMLAKDWSSNDTEVLMHLYSVIFKAAKEGAMV